LRENPDNSTLDSTTESSPLRVFVLPRLQKPVNRPAPDLPAEMGAVPDGTPEVEPDVNAGVADLARHRHTSGSKRCSTAFAQTIVSPRSSVA